MTIGDLLSLSRDITVTACLLIALVGAVRRWWVPSWVYQQSLDALEDMRRERDEFKRELFGSLGVADRATRVGEEIAQRAVRPRPERGD